MERRVTILGFVCALIAGSLQAATFTVTTTADSGAGSLRQAILDSNANGSGVADTIEFDINAAGVQTITLATALPTISTPVVIDGYSQNGASANTLPLSGGSNAVILIALDGVNQTFSGLVFGAGSSGSTVRGLSLQRFYAGVSVGSADTISIVGNFIGVDASGTVAAGNIAGVSLGEVTSAGQVGGVAPSLRNVISANAAGVELNVGATDHLIAGNLIGIAKDGTTPLGNTFGVSINGASDNTVLDNVISGNNTEINSAGVVIRQLATANSIVGNFIGTSANGTGSVPNRYGIRIAGGLLGGTPADTLVGTAAEPNVIANNQSDGVLIEAPSSTGNTIQYNVFRNNGELAIDLSGEGPTPNDALDGDVGSNLLQNYPVISSATQAPDNSVVLMGTLNSTPSTQFALQFHYAVACDPSGFGEGEHVGDATVTTDAGGNAAFTVNLPFLPAGGNVTATATDPNGNTSEFSACVVLAPAVPPATVDLGITKQGPSTIAAGANVTYTITVTNPGSTAATNVVVTDDLPPSLTFVSATPSQGSCNASDPVICNLGGLAGGATGTITLVATASTTPGPVANTASVSATEVDPNAGNNAGTSTATIAANAPADVPALDFAGLALIVTILALGAVFRLR
jgi:uncharacterized repeat protein (TIGR01451 family)